MNQEKIKKRIRYLQRSLVQLTVHGQDRPHLRQSLLKSLKQARQELHHGVEHEST